MIDRRSSIILFILLWGASHGMAQESLTLDQCYLLAEKNYPLISQRDMLTGSAELKIRNLQKNFLPQLNMGGSASLQSDVTMVSIELPAGLPELAMPVISKDWYKLTLDVNQAVYDGRMTHYQKQIETITLQADQKSVEAELYKLKDRVSQIYFAILLADQNLRILESSRDRIGSKLRETESAILQGSMTEMNGDLLRAELVRIEQEIMATRNDRTTAYEMLSEFISEHIPDSVRLAVPVVELPSDPYENRRPEYQLFDIQRARIEVMRSMVNVKRNPKIYAYGQAGYGRPGLNMLDNSFRPWWLIGAKITWNPWNWNTDRDERKILGLQGEILKTQQETYDKNLKISSHKELGEVTKATRLLEKDQQIIDLRAKITRTAASQLDNGVITSSDYISRLNEETQARLTYEIHRLQLIRAKLAYLYLLGKL